MWISKYRLPSGAVRVSSSRELHEKYDALLKVVVVQNDSLYKLCKALQGGTPPVYVSDAIAKEWFKRYRSDLTVISHAGQLEMQVGQRIRDDGTAQGMDAAALRVWLRTVVLLEVYAITCQTWLSNSCVCCCYLAVCQAMLLPDRML